MYSKFVCYLGCTGREAWTGVVIVVIYFVFIKEEFISSITLIMFETHWCTVRDLFDWFTHIHGHGVRH